MLETISSIWYNAYMSKVAHGKLRTITSGAVNNCNFRLTKFALIVGIVFTLFLNTDAYGYSTNFNYATSAKWTNNLNFMICIANGQGKEYEALFIKAVDEWKTKWPNFAYTISYASGCHINVYIVNTHSMLADHGYVGYTNIEHWQHGAITKADIILPTHKKITVTTEVKGKIVTEEYLEPLSTKQFYRASLHEFGHALNLGHFDDNGIEPIDIMHPYPADEDQEQGISHRDIQALNWYYLGFFGQEIKVRTDRMNYEAGDTVNISGKVGNVILGKAVTIEIFADKKLKSDSVKVGSSGTFSYRMTLPHEMEDGSYTVKASYNGLTADASFGFKNSKSKITDIASEVRNTDLPFATGKRVTALDAQIVDYAGAEVVSIHPYERVFIRSSFSSNLTTQTEATYIIQVKNSQGYTVEILSAAYKAAGLSTIAHSWLPDEQGVYSIEVFLWDSSVTEPLIPNPVTLEVTVT